MKEKLLKTNARDNLARWLYGKVNQLCSVNLGAKLSMLLVAMMLCSQMSFAQKVTVTGVVVNAEKEPLAGVAIFNEGANPVGATTDAKGKYTITVPANTRLHYTYLGMKEVIEPVNNRKMVNVVMNQDETTQLESVVVSVGYGQVAKRDLTGSVGQADMSEISKAPVTSIDQALAGRIAGLNIVSADGSPGAEATVVIRGGGLSQDAAPLYVIDGFPIENFNLSTLDPKSIESFEVLKDASSIAIYGSRGANGVIIINTATAKQGAPRISYDFNMSLNTRPNFIEMMGTYDYVKLQLELDALDKRTFSYNSYLGKEDPETGLRPRTLDYYLTDPGTDWQKAVTQNGITHSHNLTLSGGNEGTKYMVKGSYLDQEGLVINTGLTRYSFLGKIDQKLRKNLNMQLNASYTNTTTKNNQGFNRARSYMPTTGVMTTEEFIAEMEYLINNDPTYTDSGVDYGSLITPLQQAQNELDKRIQGNYQLGVQLQWKPFKDITISPRFQSTSVKTEIQRYYNSQTSQGMLIKKGGGVVANANGINAYLEDDLARSYMGELIINYSHVFNKVHSVSAMYGANYQYNELKQNSYSVLNIAPEFEYLGLYGIISGTVKGGQVDNRETKNQLLSSFGRINYSYKNKYLFTATGRYDGSSKFVKGKQWGFFPSGAFAWRISQEPFMKATKSVIDDAKVRLSYGKVGNNRGVNDFSYLYQFGNLQPARRYPLDGMNLANGIYQYFLANPTLTWETTTEFDAGIDVYMFKNRLTFSFDYYNKKVTDLLMPVKAPSYMGYANNTMYKNAASTRSQGVEFTLVSTNISKPSFSWSTNFNISYNQNKLLSLNNDTNIITAGTNAGFTPNSEYWVGQVGGYISQFYGFKFDRLYQEGDFFTGPDGTYILKPGIPGFATTQGGYHLQPGDPMYIDLNKDGKIDDNDRTTLGSPIPVVTGGMSNTFTYKDFSLNIFFQYSLGAKILDVNKAIYESTGSYNRYSNQYESYKNHWTPENTNTTIPRVMRPNSKGDVSNSAAAKLSDRLIQSADYLRLSTVSLTYNLPKKLLSRIKIQNIALTVSGQNLFVWTKYTGQDPEVNSFNYAASPKGLGYNVLTNSNTYSSMTAGLDNAPYPRARIFNVAASITF